MMRFLDFIFPPRVDEAVVREVSDDDLLALVAARLAPLTRPGTVVLLPFSDPRVRSIVHEAKYHGSPRAFDLLALALVEYLGGADDLRHPVIIPIPLGRARRRERGYNQVEEVARRIAKQVGAQVDTALLTRTRETTSQVSLPREKREENMRGAFGAAHPIDPLHTYLLVDDVVTTGATLQSAIDALARAGATHIIPIALAH